MEHPSHEAQTPPNAAASVTVDEREWRIRQAEDQALERLRRSRPPIKAPETLYDIKGYDLFAEEPLASCVGAQETPSPAGEGEA